MSEIFLIAPSWYDDLILSIFVQMQYSQKEDKYEEEIKVLTDKLKEASESN